MSYVIQFTRYSVRCFALARSFLILSQSFPFVKNFFQVFSNFFELFRFSCAARSDLGILSHQFPFVNNFFQNSFIFKFRMIFSTFCGSPARTITGEAFIFKYFLCYFDSTSGSFRLPDSIFCPFVSF